MNYIPCLTGTKLPGYQKEASLTSTYIKEALSNQSELVTQKLDLEGYSEYSDDGLPGITKGDFSMTYNAEVTAGIDEKKSMLLLMMILKQ